MVRLFNNYRMFYEQPDNQDLAKRFIAERTHAGESVTPVAAAWPEEMSGFCQLYPSFCSVAAGPIYVLYDLFVSPGARQAGIATALLQAAAASGKSDGKIRMDLTTAKTNLRAQALYESLRWERDEPSATARIPRS